jgi:prephenate dehydrogenase
VILTPLPETDPAALARVEALWTACGARVTRLDAARHDRVLAAVSHLPHLLAALLVAELAARPDCAEYLAHAGSGFRDFTRIAAGSPEMWRDIAMANRAALLAELAAYRRALDTLSLSIQHADAPALETLLARAADLRRQWGTGAGKTDGGGNGADAGEDANAA